MDLGLGKRTALVTGSHRGTGAATARVLAAEGASVIVHGLEPGQPDAVVESILAEGGKARGVVADLLDDNAVAAMADEVGTEIDIVVCNYGVAAGGRWSTADDDAWLEAYERNVLSAVRVIRAFRPALVERAWGRIVLLGTVGSLRPAPIRPQYYSAKSALPGLVVSLAQDLAQTGVTANLVSPGLIATPEVLERLRGRSVTEAFGSDLAPLTTAMTTPDEVGAVVAFLCSDQASSITGSNFRIDGGAARAVTP
ncbi:MAG: SDR family oxidoreductase [Acidimicrobiales bacterium]